MVRLKQRGMQLLRGMADGGKEVSLLRQKENYELVNTLIGDARFVVFDTELTGLKLRKDSIVSIGAVTMVGGRIMLGDYFYRLVEPRTPLNGHSILIHEITPGDVAQCPDIDTLLPEFLEFCRDAVLVGHFISMDLGFINQEMKRLFGESLRTPAVDTQRIYQWLARNRDNYCAFHGGCSEDLDLATLAAKFKIPVTRAHNALYDAYVTAQLFQRLLASLNRFGINTVGELINIGKP